MCLFPRQVKGRVNARHLCFQRCRRGFSSLGGWGLAGHRVVSSGAGLGAAQPEAALIPRLQRRLLFSPSSCRAPSSPSPLPRRVRLLPVRRSAPPPHRHHRQLHTPRPASGMTQDPPWAPLPAHPWSVSSIHLRGQVRVPSRSSQRLHANILPEVNPVSCRDVPLSPSPQLHGEGRHQACCMHCYGSCCIHRRDPAPGCRKGSPTAGCGETD